VYRPHAALLWGAGQLLCGLLGMASAGSTAVTGVVLLLSAALSAAALGFRHHLRPHEASHEAHRFAPYVVTDGVMTHSEKPRFICKLGFRHHLRPHEASHEAHRFAPYVVTDGVMTHSEKPRFICKFRVYRY
jgi:hypothetical protein